MIDHSQLFKLQCVILRALWFSTEGSSNGYVFGGTQQRRSAKLKESAVGQALRSNCKYILFIKIS
jgi:hypothetical protein